MMQKEVLVSVVVPVFNVGRYIETMLESVIHQTYNNLELILVNDGSTDDSIKLAEVHLKATNLNWRIISQTNSGQASARNHGIREAKGEWVICPDSDDYIAKSMVERMMQVADKEKVECVFSNFKYVTEDTIRTCLTVDDTSTVLTSDEMKKHFFNRSLKIAAPAILMKKSLFERVWYDENCPFTEDTHFIWRLLYEVDRIAYVTGDYYNYLMRNSSTIHTLKSEKYLRTSQIFEELSAKLSEKYPNDYYAGRIAPRQRLGSLRMLAKCNDYDVFRETVLKDGYRKDMGKLVFCKDLKTSLHALIFCTSLKIYYKVVNKCMRH